MHANVAQLLDVRVCYPSAALAPCRPRPLFRAYWRAVDRFSHAAKGPAGGGGRAFHLIKQAQQRSQFSVAASGVAER